MMVDTVLKIFATIEAAIFVTCIILHYVAPSALG